MFNEELFLLPNLGNKLNSKNIGTITLIKLWHLYEMEFYIKITFSSHFDTVLRISDMLTNKAWYTFTYTINMMSTIKYVYLYRKTDSETWVSIGQGFLQWSLFVIVKYLKWLKCLSIGLVLRIMVYPFNRII